MGGDLRSAVDFLGVVVAAIFFEAALRPAAFFGTDFFTAAAFFSAGFLRDAAFCGVAGELLSDLLGGTTFFASTRSATTETSDDRAALRAVRFDAALGVSVESPLGPRRVEVGFALADSR